ncbi:hypothetical protein BH10PSE17_BH10PSE17_27250 [soil metagenome]
MSAFEPPRSLVDAARMRSGTAARLAGLPVATLRVWERRYEVVRTARSDSGQRLYSNHDVLRLRLMRQLTHAGHAIGTLASLSLEALQALVAGVPTTFSVLPTHARTAVVVGRMAAHKLESVAGWTLRAVHDSIEQAAAADRDEGVTDLLLIRLESLQAASVPSILALGQAVSARTIVVIYGFGAEHSAAALLASGVTARREPITARELAQLLRGPVEAPPLDDAGWRVAQRVFDDDRLMALADLPSPVACECLRHMTEIVTQLNAFERYSQDCVSSGPDDAALHLHLSRMAGAARTLFESALERVLSDSGAAT